jgi:exosortase/archaeosortase family protein
MFFGWRCAKLFMFPAAYLLFCIPLATFLDFVTIHLRYMAGATSLAVLNGIGLEAVREGTAVISRGAHPFAVDVAEPCSGLRSLFALMAITAGYAYRNQPTWMRRSLLFACSIPLAVAGNVARIVSICVIACCTDPQFATGFYHDYSGFIVFLVAIFLMVVAGKLIDRAFNRCHAEEGNTAVESPEKSVQPVALAGWSPKMSHAVCSATAAALISGVLVFQAKTPPATIAKAPEVRFVELAGYTTDDEKFAEQQKVSEGELKILPGDTRIYKKMYESRSGAQFLVSFVVGGVSRASIHRPELCLPSQGYVMSNPRNVDVDGRPWHVIDIAKPGAYSAMEAYTFFNQEDFRTASHTHRIWRDVIDRSVLNRVDRWVMLTVHAAGATEGDLLEFLKAMGAFK